MVGTVKRLTPEPRMSCFERLKRVSSSRSDLCQDTMGTDPAAIASWDQSKEWAERTVDPRKLEMSATALHEGQRPASAQSDCGPADSQEGSGAPLASLGIWRDDQPGFIFKSSDDGVSLRQFTEKTISARRKGYQRTEEGSRYYIDKLGACLFTSASGPEGNEIIHIYPPSADYRSAAMTVSYMTRYPRVSAAPQQLIQFRGKQVDEIRSGDIIASQADTHCTNCSVMSASGWAFCIHLRALLIVHFERFAVYAAIPQCVARPGGQ